MALLDDARLVDDATITDSFPGSAVRALYDPADVALTDEVVLLASSAPDAPVLAVMTRSRFVSLLMAHAEIAQLPGGSFAPDGSLAPQLNLTRDHVTRRRRAQIDSLTVQISETLNVTPAAAAATIRDLVRN